MKVFSLIAVCCIPFLSTAQRSLHFDTVFVNRTAKEFFVKNPGVNKVVLHLNEIGSKQLLVYPKSIWVDTSYKTSPYTEYEHFNFNFKGDVYRFEKKYSRLTFPLAEMRKVQSRRCNDFTNLDVIIAQDSIKCSFEYSCPSAQITPAEENEEKVFIKIPRLANYRLGVAQLQRELQDSLKNKFHNKGNAPFDSAVIFKVALDKKDSSLKRIELVDGKYSSFVQFLINELKIKRSWTPSWEGDLLIVILKSLSG